MFTFAKKETHSKQKQAKEKEKASVRQEFEGKELEDIKSTFQNDLDECQETLEDELSYIKSGRASPNMFDDLEVKAYGELHVMKDLATVSV